MATCNTLVPSFDHMLRIDNEMLECLRTPNHSGEHVVYQESKRRYIGWEHDSKCADCQPEECECFVFWEISETVAQKLINFKKEVADEVPELRT